MKPFEEFVVVELIGSIAGGYAGKLLRDRGAQVTLVDPEPAPLEAEHAAWHFLHSAKTIVTDLTCVPDLAASADLVIESSDRGPLRCQVPAADGLVRLHISPHGQSGVYADFMSSDLTDWALSGHQYLYGHPDRHPIPGPPNQPAYAAGLLGCIGALAALVGGEGDQTVEVSHVEAMASLHQFTLLRQQFGGQVLTRMGNRFTGQGEPNSIYPCADGWVSIVCVTDTQIESLLSIIDREWVMDQLDSPQDIQLHPELIEDGLVAFLADRRRDEVVELFQALRIPACPMLTMLDLPADPHLEERDWWQEAGGRRLPGPPVRTTPIRANPAGARRAGAPDDPHAEHQATPLPMEGKVGFGERSDEGGLLSGLRVLDLTRVWAGPLAARILADLGAEVIMVEAPWNRGLRTLPQSVVEITRLYPDNDPGQRHWNRNGHTNKYAAGKKSVVLDLSKPEGIDVFKRLATSADVVLDNYSPRVMPQFGLADTDLHEINPDCIAVTMPGYGRSGPAADWVAYGSCLDSHGGLTAVTGYADDHPWKGGVAWPDPIAGLHAAVFTLMTLWDRMAGTSRGQSVEVAQLESLVNVVGDQVLAAQLGGGHLPLGGRHQTEAPHGVYPCLGDDRWLSVSVADDGQWRALVEVVGLPAPWNEWTAADRQAHHDEIDAAITTWTRTHDPMLAMYRLQEAGVAAGAVLDAADVRSDPQLNSRALLQFVDQPDVGWTTLPRTPIRINGRFPEVGPAPLFGQHNDEVLGAAGVDVAGRTKLRSLGVVTDEPPE